MPNPEEIKARLIEIDETLNRLAEARGELAQELRETALQRKQELQVQLASMSRGARETPYVSPDPALLESKQMVFCLIPKGAFLFGPRARKVQTNQYWVGKYPVTNAQFEQFVQDHGYERPAYWEKAREMGAWTSAGFKSRLDGFNRSLSSIGPLKDIKLEGPRRAPISFGPPFDLPVHPVVGITWYEAAAFVCWLNEKLGEWGKERENRAKADQDRADEMWAGLRTGKLQFALPTEGQWEKAARGPQGRIYPWRGEYDPTKANTTETGLGTTSPVGSFPDGASVYGLMDASGNVWEWTASALGGTFLMCGGSFYYTAEKARCTVRRWEEPDYWLWDTGFRVAVSVTASQA